ncbi:MAG TPA: patatin-like phospholipase family protein, partial [Nitrospira sp.]
MRHVAAVLSASILATGCFAKIHELPSQPESAEALFAPLADQDFMVGLAVSGGGSRAATFAAGALEALAELPVRVGAEKRSVLETVSYMSSVSGGSLATAYYVTKKPPRSEPVLVEDALSPRYREFFSAFKTAMGSNFQRSAVFRQLAFFRALNPT